MSTSGWFTGFFRDDRTPKQRRRDNLMQALWVCGVFVVFVGAFIVPWAHGVHCLLGGAHA